MKLDFMEKETEERKLNEDYIAVVLRNNGHFEYKEIDIPRNHQNLISNIKSILDNDNVSLPAICNDFSSLFPGEPKTFHYCFPYEYDASFINDSDYPKVYSEEVYHTELKDLKNDYIEKHKIELEKELKDEKIDEIQYHKRFDQIVEDAENYVTQHVTSIKSDFVAQSVRYIHASEFYSTLDKIKSNENIIMYSTEDKGFNKIGFKYQINNDLVIKVDSNFCYGRSSYFHVNLIFKGIMLLSYPLLVQYYYTRMIDVFDCTTAYDLKRSSWKKALNFVVDQANLIIDNENAFVNKWIIEGSKQLVNRLWDILNNPIDVFEKLLQNDLGEDTIFTFRNITKEERSQYNNLYHDEMIIAFQAEKIARALLFIPNLKKLSVLYNEIDSIIEEIECINKRFFPKLDTNIHSLQNKIDNKSKILDDFHYEFSNFSNKNRKILRNFVNKDDDELIGYFKIHPEEEAIYIERNKYLISIKSLKNEIGRLTEFREKLFLLAQLIFDCGLANTSSDDYLSVNVYKPHLKLQVTEKCMQLSKNKIRLFNVAASMHDVVIPDTVKVICEYAFSGNRWTKKIKLPINLQIIGNYSFRNCQNLSEIVIPNSVKEIGKFAFQECKSLNKIVLSSTLKKIGDCAFVDCDSLQTITLPDSIEEIGDNIFYGCSKLQSIIINRDSKYKFEKLIRQYRNKIVCYHHKNKK